MMKYAAAILTALALVGTGWAIVVATRPIPAIAPASDVSPELNQQLKSSEAELLHLRGLAGTLDQINRLTLTARQPTAVLALHDSQTRTSATGKVTPPAKPDISLVYVSPDLQKVVINGKLLGAGDRLPGGGRLISITQERVVFDRQGRRAVLQLPKPHVLGIESNSSNVR